MAHSKPNLILALLLLNTAWSAAGASVMRVHHNGQVEALQTESVTGLENMFSDDTEAKAMTAELLEGAPSEASDLLPFIQKLKEQIQPWHGIATAALNTAIEDIKSCTAGMENGMRETETKKDSCSAKSTSHAKHRTDESTKFTTKEHWKAETAEKKEQKTTECNAFQTVKDEARATTASYGGGDAEAYLESVSQQVCSDLLPRYNDHKGKCTTATAEHVRVSGIYETKNTEYTVQKTASDAVQTEMDVNCCAYALATQEVCESHDTCYEDKVEAYKAVKATVEAEEKIKKVEWRVYSRIECLLPLLGTGQADKIEECRANTHSTGHLDIDYPTIPEKSTCNVVQDFPGTEAYKNAHYGNLPDNAQGKAVAQCAGMTQGAQAQSTPAEAYTIVDASKWFGRGCAAYDALQTAEQNADADSGRWCTCTYWWTHGGGNRCDTACGVDTGAGGSSITKIEAATVCSQQPHQANVAKVVSTYTKNGGGKTYNAYAMWLGTAACITAGQKNKHVRVGLTSNPSDRHGYPNGKYIGLFPNGRLYKPPGTDSKYTSSDVICIRQVGADIVASKNNQVVETWAGSAGSGDMYVKLWFYEEGSSVTVREEASTNNAHLALDKIKLGAAGQSCEQVCASHGGCDPTLEERIFATGDAIGTMKAIATSQGRTCKNDHANGHALSPYINKGTSTQCNVGDGTPAASPCSGGHPADQRFCLCNQA